MMNPERFEPKFEIAPEVQAEEKKEDLESREDPKRFLGFEELTQSSDDIKKLAEKFRSGEELQRVENILSFLGDEKNLNHVNLERENPKEWKKLFNKRAAEEIFESKTSYGCTDTATLFLTMTRECGIPAKFIEGKRLGKSGTHSWAQVFVEGKWINVDPTQGRKGMEFKPEESKHGPYKIISESLGPSDSLISSYKDWKKIEKMWDYKKNTFKKEIEKVQREISEKENR